jgi:hypothetical protein
MAEARRRVDEATDFYLARVGAFVEDDKQAPSRRPRDEDERTETEIYR